jgi:phosphohistidine phosphatase
VKTILLLRHAKSSWADPALADFDRPLSPRGRKAAAAMGRYLAASGMRPDLVLSSPAARTRATLDIISEVLPEKPPTEYREDLYLASGAALLASLRALPESVARVMLVGHNPGLHALALDLYATGNRAAMHSLARKFPTGALAIITVEGAWRALQVGQGHLAAFVTPRMLAEGTAATGQAPIPQG